MPDPKDPEKSQSDPTVQLTPEEIAQLGLEREQREVDPHDPDDELVGTLLRGKWRVLERIGAGSFGTVYKVRDERGGWIEALKILSFERLKGAQAENMRQRFLREARIMKRLGAESQHIVGLSTYEEDIESGLIYFLMEHVEGRVLSAVLAAEGPFSMERAIRISLQVCDALMIAHEGPEPVVHRDLKLENLMLTTDRNGEEIVKVLDFGIAKIAEQDGDSRLTAVGTLGTPGYAAPEQLRAGDVDGRTDLFAFGVILYSLMTGRNPWLGHLAHRPTNQTYELMAASDRGAALAIEESGIAVPQEMVDVIMRLLRREPKDRFQSARELQKRLLEIQSGAAAWGGAPGAPLDASTAGLRGAPRGNVLVDVSTTEMEKRERDAPERRLAAVWFADLVGYSSLSSTDEDAALALLDTFHSTARRVIPEGGGRLVQFIGDAAFAEFTSTERAVRTATEFVAEFTEATQEVGTSPQLRVGVHVGDVLIGSDGDLFGDGVNVAARIQNEAEPGQILVSQDVWRQLKQRRDFGFISVGERDLKGIGSPVWLFAVAEAGVAEGPTPVGTDPSLPGPGRGRSRAVRVARVGWGYLAAAAVIYFSSTLLVDALGLDPWVIPAAAALLVVGLAVVLTTAWVQSRPTWDRSVGDQAPWALDVPDLIDSVSRREVPQLTWARAMVGGVAAFALLFGAAGLFVWVTEVSTEAPVSVPVARGSLPTLAIAAFATSGDAGLWAEGVPDLLGLALEDVGGLRVIDPGVVYGRAGAGDAPTAIVRAGAVGADFAIGGTAELTGDQLAITLGVYDVASELLLGEASVSGGVDDVSGLVAELANVVVEGGSLPLERSGAGSVRLAEITTTSAPGLLSFLEGERSLRRSDVVSAIASYENAVAADPDFAVALWKLALARSWTVPLAAPSVDPDAERAESLGAELTERDRLLVSGLNAINRGSTEAIQYLEEATTSYPDDPTGWFLLGDALFHLGDQARAADATAAFEQARRLVPDFGPAYAHLVDGALARGDTTTGRELVAALREQGAEGTLVTALDQRVAEARIAGEQTAQATLPPEPEAEDPLAAPRAQYRGISGTVGGVRSRARTSLHPALGETFADAERMWADAESAAQREDYQAAVSTLQTARPIYEAVQRDSESMHRVDAAQEEVDRLRTDARDPGLTTQANQAEQRASQAVAQGRYEDAVDALNDAADLLDRAAQAPPAGGGNDGQPTPAPPTPAEITDQVLSALKAAMDAEDIGGVRRIWTSISADEAQGLETLFASVHDMSVSYAVASVQERGSTLVVTVRTTYNFVSDQSGQAVSTETGQVFDLQQSGTEWIISGSRSEGP